MIALAGNKLDLVRAPVASEGDDESDDATATPENDDDNDEGAETVVKAEPASESRRQVSTEEAQAYATENGLLFFETSAKTGEGVVEVFTEIGTSEVLHSCMRIEVLLTLLRLQQPRRSLSMRCWLRAEERELQDVDQEQLQVV